MAAGRRQGLDQEVAMAVARLARLLEDQFRQRQAASVLRTQNVKQQAASVGRLPRNRVPLMRVQRLQDL